MSHDVTVTVSDLKTAQMCARGVRIWATRHGLDYQHFIKHGYPASVLDNTDALGKKVADIARRRAAGEED